MNYINFLRVSLCLLLNASILYSSEVEDTTRGWLNPLKQKATYLDEDGKFTLANAKKNIEESEEDLVNHQGTSSERSCNNPLRWLCVHACSLEPLTEENRLELATFFSKSASDKSIKEAYLFCQHNYYNSYIETANSKIAILLNSMIELKKIEVKAAGEEDYDFAVARYVVFKRGVAVKNCIAEENAEENGLYYIAGGYQEYKIAEE